MFGGVFWGEVLLWGGAIPRFGYCLLGFYLVMGIAAAGVGG